MEQSASMQVRLQQLVEGFSVVALSYYCLGLISYLLKGAESVWPILSVSVVDAALVPIIVTSLWFGIHHLKQKVVRA